MARASDSRGLPRACPRALAAASAAFVRCADHRALFLGEGREQVQHERVDVRAKLAADEWDLLRHEP